MKLDAIPADDAIGTGDSGVHFAVAGRRIAPFLEHGALATMFGNHDIVAMAGTLDCTVTVPLNKEAINLAGHHFDGHIKIYATSTGTKKCTMMLAGDSSTPLE